MIRVKFGNIYLTQDVIGKILNEPIPIRAAINIKKLVDRLLKEYNFIETERLNLIKKYGENIPGTENWQVKPENSIKFNEELSELFDVEVELSEVDKIKIEDLKDIKISVADYSKLESFLDN